MLMQECGSLYQHDSGELRSGVPGVEVSPNTISLECAYFSELPAGIPVVFDKS
jgi:hypothetical protein